MAKILFYSPVGNVSLFDRVGFYATDIRILKEIGHGVEVANSLKEVLTRDYDVLFVYFYTWGSLAVSIARLRGKIALMTGGADDLDPSYNKSSRKLLLHRFFFRLGYLFSSEVLAVSKTDYGNFSRLVGERKLSLVPHVVDTSYFTPGLGQLQRTFVTIGWMGTEGNVRRKGMDVAVRLLAELNVQNWCAQLVIAGTPGPGTDMLRKLAEDLGVSKYVEFRFNISEEEKIDLLQSVEYYLQLSEFEGFGLAALEALSCGACVVHTGRGGLADFMDNLGLCQKWPLDISDIAKNIIENNNSIFKRGQKIEERHRFVVQNYSLAKRREAMAAKISI
ncbi:MAG: glycosyltransferase family 4 protein [Rhodoferax sp.]